MTKGTLTIGAFCKEVRMNKMKLRERFNAITLSRSGN